MLIITKYILFGKPEILIYGAKKEAKLIESEIRENNYLSNKN